jgi:hypothetical protein
VKQVEQQNLEFCSSCERQTLDPGAIDAAQGVCRLTLAVALSARASDVGTPLRQTLVKPLFPRLSCGDFQCTVTTDAEQRLTGEQGMRLSIDFAKWSSVLHRHAKRARPLVFEVQCATDAGTASVGGATDAYVAHEICPTASFRRGTSINTWWPTLGSHSWTFDILVSTLS